MTSKWGKSPFDDDYKVVDQQTSDDAFVTPKKSVAKSKTVWSGITVSGLSILTYLQNVDFIANYPMIIAIIGVLIGVGMIVLRFLTDQPVQTPSVVLRPKKVPGYNSDNTGPAQTNQRSIWGK